MAKEKLSEPQKGIDPPIELNHSQMPTGENYSRSHKIRKVTKLEV